LLLIVTLFSVVYSQTLNLVLLKDSLADGAACLDGSPAAYYFRAGSGSGANKWLLNFQGGGWCNSLTDCLGRSKTVLGSSLAYPATENYDTGFLSTSQLINPLMYNWNVAYFPYCDGASFSGNNNTITQVSGTSLYFRGFQNLRAYLKDLNANHQFQMGTDYVIGGCSAGGLAVYLHVDWWRDNLPATARVRGLPDSGYFLDYNSPNFTPKFANDMRWIFKQQNVSSGVNQGCIAGAKDTSDCIFAEHTVPFIKTPIFPLQSRYDSWQIDNILGTKDDTEVNNYGTLFDTRFQAVAAGAPNGYFLDSCYHHCAQWNNIRIDTQLNSQAFGAWYNGATQDRFFQQQTYPCTACCTP